jgi:hypothetical protein
VNERPPEDAPRRLVDEARDETVTSGLLALRGDMPSERSRRDLLVQLGLEAEPAAVAAAAEKGGWERARSVVLGLLLGIALGLGWAVYRRYGQ